MLATGVRLCRLIVRKRLWLSFALPPVLFLAACGGSSSETPPPLEPDPIRLGRGLPAVQAAPREAAKSPRAPVVEDPFGLERASVPEAAPPRRTWGTDEKSSRGRGVPELAPAP